MKNIVVVGGTKGIGKNIVQLLKDDNLFVLARTNNEMSDTGNVHFIEADVTQPTIDLSMSPEVIDGLYIVPEV
jgi:NAD(P)-dependent dehydrogenase (short-subunit alcohol dehydrogenase family)